MDIEIILLLVLAAMFHSVWNVLAKKSLDKQVFLWLSLLTLSIIFFIPFYYLYAYIPLIGWGYIILSGILEAIYFILLGSAYQRGDLSLVYPLARGSAPLFVTLLAFFFLDEAISLEGLAGILLIVGGLYTMHLRSLSWQELGAPLMSLRERTSRLALLTGLTTACYLLVDKVGISYVDPLLYVYLIFFVAAVLIAPYMILRKSNSVTREWRANKLSIVAVAVMYVAAYLLVLFAMRSSKLGYISSVREVSVVFTAIVGTLVLQEAFAGRRILGSIFIFAGILLIALAR